MHVQSEEVACLFFEVFFIFSKDSYKSFCSDGKLVNEFL